MKSFIIFTPRHAIISRRTHEGYEKYTKNVSLKARKADKIYWVDDTKEMAKKEENEFGDKLLRERHQRHQDP